MLCVLITALGFAALRQPYSPIWASTAFTLTVVTLMTTTLGSLFNYKITWAGFSLFGWGYLIWAFGPWRVAIATPLPAPPSTLLLHAIANSIYANYLAPGLSFTTGNEVHGLLAFDGIRGFRVPYSFLQVGNCIFSLLMACVGSAMGRFAARGGKQGRS